MKIDIDSPFSLAEASRMTNMKPYSSPELVEGPAEAGIQESPFLLARACPELAEGFPGLQPRIGVRGRLFAGETVWWAPGFSFCVAEMAIPMMDSL